MSQPSKKQRSPRKSISSNNAWKKVVDTGRTLEILRCLRRNDQRRVAEAVALLKQVQSSLKRQKYQLFLHDVLSRCGPHGFLLCAIALGQTTVVGMRKSDRATLVDELEKRKDQPPINHPIFRSLAKRQKIPDSAEARQGRNVEAERDSTSISTCRTNALPTETHKRSAHEGSPNNSNVTTAQEVFEHASLEGIATVFDQYICGAIRRDPIQIDRITFWRASVTTVFPLWGGPVDCLLSLDICEWGVEYLAMALFNAKVKWVEQVLHIVLNEGITLIVPNSEATLKGVRDEALIMVFGSDIHKAINESPVHRRELEEGKHVTEYILSSNDFPSSNVQPSIVPYDSLPVRHANKLPCLHAPKIHGGFKYVGHNPQKEYEATPRVKRLRIKKPDQKVGSRADCADRSEFGADDVVVDMITVNCADGAFVFPFIFPLQAQDLDRSDNMVCDDRDIVAKHPLSDSIDRLQRQLRGAEQAYDVSANPQDEICHRAISKLLTTLMGEEAAFNLRSRVSDQNVDSDLAGLFKRLRQGHFNYHYYRALAQLVIQKAPDINIWKAVLNLTVTISRSTPPASVPPSFDGTPVKSTSSSQKGSEQTRELVNPRIFEEIRGCTFRDVEGFFDKYFEGKDWSDKADAICRRVLAPDSDGNWAQFPDPPTQDDVLAWWFRLQEDLLSESRGTYYTTGEQSGSYRFECGTGKSTSLLRASGSEPPRGNPHELERHPSLLAELKKPKEKIETKTTLLQMSRCVREVFAAQPTRRFVHAFAVCGTKMEAWVFDRSGPYSSGIIDVYADSRRFFQVIVGYTMMSDEELGLDTFIARDEGGSKSITVKGPGISEEKVLRLGEMLSFQRAIVCRGTTCFLANDGQVEGVAKFSWVSDKRRPEAELLELAGQKNVQGVARIIGHSVITSIADVRCGLTFGDKRHDFKSAPPSAASSFHQSQPLTELRSLGRKSSSRKRRSPDKGMQASKRSRSINQPSRDNQQENELAFSVQSAHKPSLFDRNGEEPYDNRVLRCLVISPAGRPIYKYESLLELLTALRDAIKAHRSLYLDGSILHRDISENNIIITDPEKADGHSGMLIDLDLAKEVGSGRSGARHQTGTMEFMAIEVLLNIDHTYRHDLESFFYVLIWQCARHGWEKLNELQRQGQDPPKDSMLREWYTGTYKKIATYKRGNMEAGGFEYLLQEFPPDFERVKHLCKTIRGVLFPYGKEGLIVGTPQDPKRLYDPIIKAYDDTIALIET
ncbi:predicted protein [Histoplasma mississippiense (nom. inval.)]|uniref:predicted protein n=1 Tax=Ajellomyces capsulatus (strain NAm1 / WU24) TaxID=2059318 RepID=UPI000157BAA2|nr:predicted protein [Histoplasma mississippiense (nom. inval.)]EDN05787.1 predicted protein [Histoplasma mississippiense (nom. inval.)]